MKSAIPLLAVLAIACSEEKSATPEVETPAAKPRVVYYSLGRT